MAKDKKEVRYDADGARRVMRGGDYMADFGGQLALGLMSNIVGQLTYFYTDKVGLAVGRVGIVMAIAKVMDALTDVIFGNIIEVHMNDSTIERAILPDQGFTAEHIEGDHYNQLSGKEMVARFVDGELRFLDISGNV